MGPGSAAHRRGDAALRPGHESFVQRWTRLRILAARFARALLRRLTLNERGRREGREPVGSHWLPCQTRIALRCTAGKQGNRSIPAFPARMVGTAYVVLSPGSDALLPPSPCGWLMRAPGWATRTTTRLGAQTPGARTTRFGRTWITPVVRATCFAHGCPPCDHLRTSVAHVHRRPARVRDDRDTPLFLGPK